jgi:hypothetical protein
MYIPVPVITERMSASFAGGNDIPAASPEWLDAGFWISDLGFSILDIGLGVKHLTVQNEDSWI